MHPLTASTTLQPVQPHRLDRVATQIEQSFGIRAFVRLIAPFYASLFALDVAHSFFAPDFWQLPQIAQIALITLIASLFTLATFCTSFTKTLQLINSYRERAKALRDRALRCLLNAASACIRLRTSTRSACAQRIERAVLAAASRHLLSLSHRARLSVALSMLVYLSSIISTRAQTSTLRAAAARAAASSV